MTPDSLSHLLAPTPPQQELIDEVVDRQLDTALHVTGRRLRAGRGKEGAELLQLCVPTYLTRTNSPPDDLYYTTLHGLLVSSQASLLPRQFDAIHRFLKKRFAEDPDIAEYTVEDLHQFSTVLGRLAKNRLHILVTTANLTAGRSGNRYAVPQDIENVVNCGSVSDLLRYRLSTPQSPTVDPISTSTSQIQPTTTRKFETAFESYEVVRQIGEGAVGIVHEVRSTDGTRLALKLLKPTPRDDQTRRFKNETRFCHQFEHPNILKVLDWGLHEQDGYRAPFHVAKLYPQTLRAMLSVHREPDANLLIVLQVFSGIGAAHEKGIWHRDLKPENILLGDNANDVVVADFGAAHFVEEFLATTVETSPERRLANFEYAAPEQRRKGGPVTDKADVFAIGLMLNQVFTGTVPHGTSYRTIASVASDHQDLDELVARMIRQDPSQRPTAVEVRDLLERRLQK